MIFLGTTSIANVPYGDRRELVTVTLKMSWPNRVFSPASSYALRVVSPAGVRGLLKGAVIFTSALIAYTLPAIAEAPPTEKWMLFTEICSLSEQLKYDEDMAARDGRRVNTDRARYKLILLAGQWREAYPTDKEFKCPDTEGLCFDMCRVFMSPDGVAVFPAPKAAGCNEELSTDHPCIVAETRQCDGSSEASCRVARNLVTFARCGGVTGHAIERKCAARIRLMDHWANYGKTPGPTD